MQTYTTISIRLHRLQEIAAQYQARHGGCALVVIASHIDERGTPYGYVESTSRAAIDAIEALAR